MRPSFARCSWCRKGGTAATRLAWVKWNGQYQWVCERCAQNLAISVPDTQEEK